MIKYFESEMELFGRLGTLGEWELGSEGGLVGIEVVVADAARVVDGYFLTFQNIPANEKV